MLLHFLTWWYSEGWKVFAEKLLIKLQGALSFFSIGALVRTLFQPFRQISAGEEGNSLEDKLQVALDKFVSRLIGAMVRITLMIAGIITFVAMSTASLILLIIWPLMPLMPAGCVVLAVMGVTL